MNVTSDLFRKELSVFDRGFFNKVSKSALLRDRGYYVLTPEDLKVRVANARAKMAEILGVSIDQLPEIHTGANGRFDCDNYAILGGQIMNAQWDRECRESGDEMKKQLADLPLSRKDIDHTQSLCLTTEGFFIVEWITGEVWPATENNPEILLVG